MDSLVTVDDITMVLCVRAHEKNPWIVERLDMLAAYYDPCPPILVVDFGSERPYADQIGDICDRHGCSHLHIPDYETFSLAMARNRGFEEAKTGFLFFCDPDFISESDLFRRLARTATALRMHEVVDVILNLPAIHLDEEETERFLAKNSIEERTQFLELLAFKLNYTAFDKEAGRFTAPYSNVFLINRRMFSMCGGYNATFRGHGSEDFEFLLRFAAYSMHLPMPSKVSADLFSPLRPEFFQPRPYEGFRRLFELMSQPAESLGFKAFHLWHPTEKNLDWYANNDWKRERFNEATAKYTDSRHELLTIDYLARTRVAACLCPNKESWGYFVPLRLAGFTLFPIFDSEPETISGVVERLVAGELDAVAIFNPYMKSHNAFAGLVTLARELRRQIIVVERGALPSTIYYDDDVCYNSDSYGEAAFANERFTSDELDNARRYVADLREGNKTLESMSNYATTERRHLALKHITKPICFVPLQLEEDMAVTMFVRGETNYPEFIAGLPALVENNPDVLFVVKPHPLSKLDALKPYPNLIIADRSDNIHFLIDVADLTLCYNSGVGLLSLLHETPTVTLGNAFYNLAGAGYHAISAKDGLKRFLEGSIPPPDRNLTTRIAAWFLYRKYSTFIATDDVRESSTRKSHGYRDIQVTHFRWKQHDIKLTRAKQIAPFSWNSYAASRMSATAGSIRETAPSSKLRAWGCKDFWLGNYIKAASLFERAYDSDHSHPNYLRYAAEAYYRAGKRKEALAALARAAVALPKNKRVRARQAVIAFPLLGFLIGTAEIAVPKQ